MILCQNCSQDVGSAEERFCPHCGSMLPWARPATPAGASVTPPQTPPSPYQQTPHSPYQPAAQPSQQHDPAAYAPPTYAQPTPNGYAPPTYVSGSSGANLPAPRRGTAPPMADLANLARSASRMDNNSLIRLAVIAVLALVAAFVLFKVVSWFISILPVLIFIAAVILIWRYMQRNGRRLP